MKRLLVLLVAVAMFCFVGTANAQCTSCKGNACRVLAAPVKVVHAAIAKVADRVHCGKAVCEAPACAVEKPACEKPVEAAAGCEAKCEKTTCRRHVVRKVLGKLFHRRARCC